MRLPFVILGRERWLRIQTALEAWPRLLQAREDAHRALELEHDELFAAHQDLAKEYRELAAILPRPRPDPDLFCPPASPPGVFLWRT